MFEMAKVLRYYGLAPDIMEANPKIVCPIHDDIRPSMKVDVRDNFYYCFGCGKHGDAQQLVKEIEQKYHNLNDLQSYQQYLKILKSKDVSDIKIKKSTRVNKKSTKELYDMAYDYYHGLKKVDWCGHEETPEVSQIIDYMSYRGYSPKTLNYVKAKPTYNSQYGLIFPMLDNGKFKGWVCRTMEPDVEQYRKYLYNEGFSRATTLCGDYGKKPYVIVVEGFMDRLRFIEMGIEHDNVVAILGWKMSEQQENKLKSAGVKYVISALDNDNAGKKGTKYLKTIFKVIRFQYIKGVKDPGEMSEEVFNKCYRRTMKIYKEYKERN